MFTKETKKMAETKGWLLLGETHFGVKRIVRITGAEKIFKKQAI